MTHINKFSALVAVLVIGFFSIYAGNNNYTSTNQTAAPVNITLNMQSGAQIPVVVPPGQSVPVAIGNDQVIGLWLYGAYDPAGVNAVIACPTGGNVQQVWQMNSNGAPIQGFTEPDTQTIS